MFKLFIADTAELRSKRLNELTFSSTAKMSDEEKPWIHFCGDWDGLAITPACDEWENCSCYTAEAKKQKEDAFFAKFFDVPRPQKMSDMYDDMSEEDMRLLIHNQEEYEAWALAANQVQEKPDDFSMLSLSAAELPDEKWNPENG